MSVFVSTCRRVCSQKAYSLLGRDDDNDALNHNQSVSVSVSDVLNNANKPDKKKAKTTTTNKNSKKKSSKKKGSDDDDDEEEDDADEYDGDD